MDIKRIAVGVVGVALLCALLVIPLPSSIGGSRVFSSIEDALHGPLFAVVICLSLWVSRARSWRSYAVAWLIAALLALASEYLQGFGSRDPSWADVLTDLLGATSGLAFWLLFLHKPKLLPGAARAGLWALMVCCVFLILLPVLKSVEEWLDRSRRYPELFTTQFSGARSMTESMTEDDDVRIGFGPAGLSVLLRSGPLPGVVIRSFVPDWRGYKKLAVDVENPSTQPLQLEVHLRDRGSTTDKTDRFNAVHTLVPGQRTTLQFDLSAIEVGPQNRVLRLDQMSIIAIYRVKPGADRFIVYAIRLE